MSVTKNVLAMLEDTNRATSFSLPFALLLRLRRVGLILELAQRMTMQISIKLPCIMLLDICTLRLFLLGDAISFCCSRTPSGPMLLLRPFLDTFEGEEAFVGVSNGHDGDKFSLLIRSAIVRMVVLYNVRSKKKKDGG